MSDTYTPDGQVWQFDPAPSQVIAHQAALEFLLEALSDEDHATYHRMVERLREQADETRYHDPSVGITGNGQQADALDALANLLAASCPDGSDDWTPSKPYVSGPAKAKP